MEQQCIMYITLPFRVSEEVIYMHFRAFMTVLPHFTSYKNIRMRKMIYYI